MGWANKSDVVSFEMIELENSKLICKTLCRKDVIMQYLDGSKGFEISDWSQVVDFRDLTHRWMRQGHDFPGHNKKMSKNKPANVVHFFWNAVRNVVFGTNCVHEFPKIARARIVFENESKKNFNQNLRKLDWFDEKLVANRKWEKKLCSFDTLEVSVT